MLLHVDGTTTPCVAGCAPISISGTKRHCLIDTGASTNVVHPTSLPPKTPHFPPGPQLFTANAHANPPRQVALVHLPTSIANQTQQLPFAVSPDINYDAILGPPALQTFNGSTTHPSKPSRTCPTHHPPLPDNTSYLPQTEQAFVVELSKEQHNPMLEDILK